METMRLILTVSPHRTRGFIGEGSLLDLLADASLTDDCARLEKTLAGRWRWSADVLATNGLRLERIQRVLQRLGASGRFAWETPAQDGSDASCPSPPSQTAIHPGFAMPASWSKPELSPAPTPTTPLS
jgi:hypothetical protein